MTSENSLVPSKENQIIITSPSQRQEKIRKILEDTIAQRLIGLKETLDDDTILLDSGKKTVSAEEIIKTNKFLWIEKLDEKASLTEIIKQNNANTSSIRDAIKRINVRIFDIIEVIQLLSQLESDFYSLMEEQSIQENELRAVLTGIFREKGMTEDQIFSLLDSSFKRGNILRERIASLKTDYANLQSDFKKISSIVKLSDNSIKDIQKELVKINEIFEVLDGISDRITDLSKTKADETKVSEINDLLTKKANQSEVDGLSESVKSQESEIAHLNETLKTKADETKVSEINDLLIKKANQSEVDGLSESVKSQESKIAHLNETLKTKADETKVNEINDLLTKKANQSEVDGLSESVKSQESEIAHLNETLKTKADETKINEIKSQLNYIKIAYGLTTATLLAGLIASFLI